MRQEMLYEHANRPYLAAIASGESPCRDIAATSAPLSTSTRTQSAPPSCAATCSAVMRSLSVLFTFAPALRHYPSVYLPTPCVKKNKTLVNSSTQLPQMLTDFRNFFAGRLGGKFAANSYLNIPPHLKYVATLPCEYLCSKYRNAQ